jgi:2-keto-3-deoxygluconate permease
VAAACEATTAGNAIATPAAVAAVDPSFLAIQGTATAQVAAAVVTTAFVAPFLVAYVARRQAATGVTPENEEAYHEGRDAARAQAALSPAIP